MPKLVYVGLGSNLNNPKDQLIQAIEALKNAAQIKVHKVSSFYQSAPFDGSKQPDYVNAVIALETNLTPFALLDILQELEYKQGRIRSNERFSARTLDLDLLLFGRQQITTKKLTIPHYQIHLRRFVLEPLLEIAPNVCLPNGTKCADLLAKLSFKRSPPIIKLN